MLRRQLNLADVKCGLLQTALPLCENLRLAPERFPKRLRLLKCGFDFGSVPYFLALQPRQHPAAKIHRLEFASLVRIECCLPAIHPSQFHQSTANRSEKI